jgi:hypothetical protein
LYTFDLEEEESPKEKKDGNQKYLEFKENIISVVDELLSEFDNLSALINESVRKLYKSVNLTGF